jgi:hypothetical protein
VVCLPQDNQHKKKVELSRLLEQFFEPQLHHESKSMIDEERVLQSWKNQVQFQTAQRQTNPHKSP